MIFRIPTHWKKTIHKTRQHKLVRKFLWLPRRNPNDIKEIRWLETITEGWEFIPFQEDVGKGMVRVNSGGGVWICHGWKESQKDSFGDPFEGKRTKPTSPRPQNPPVGQGKSS